MVEAHRRMQSMTLGIFIFVNGNLTLYNMNLFFLKY